MAYTPVPARGDSSGVREEWKLLCLPYHRRTTLHGSIMNTTELIAFFEENGVIASDVAYDSTLDFIHALRSARVEKRTVLSQPGYLPFIQDRISPAGCEQLFSVFFLSNSRHHSSKNMSKARLHLTAVDDRSDTLRHLTHSRCLCASYTHIIGGSPELSPIPGGVLVEAVFQLETSRDKRFMQTRRGLVAEAMRGPLRLAFRWGEGPLSTFRVRGIRPYKELL